MFVSFSTAGFTSTIVCRVPLFRYIFYFFPKRQFYEKFSCAHCSCYQGTYNIMNSGIAISFKLKRKNSQNNSYNVTGLWFHCCAFITVLLLLPEKLKIEKGRTYIFHVTQFTKARKILFYLDKVCSHQIACFQLQTVVCFPFLGGVVELGVTDLVSSCHNPMQRLVWIVFFRLFLEHGFVQGMTLFVSKLFLWRFLKILVSFSTSKHPSWKLHTRKFPRYQIPSQEMQTKASLFMPS